MITAEIVAAVKAYADQTIEARASALELRLAQRAECAGPELRELSALAKRIRVLRHSIRVLEIKRQFPATIFADADPDEL